MVSGGVDRQQWIITIGPVASAIDGGEFMTSMPRRFLRLVDGFLPDRLRSKPDSEALFRARVTLIIPFTVGISHLYSCVAIYRRIDQLGPFGWTFWLAVAASSLLLISVVVFRRTGSFGLSANLYALGATLAVVSVVLVTGGFRSSPFSILLPLVVLFTFIMASMGMAFFWACVGLGVWSVGQLIGGVDTYPDMVPAEWGHRVTVVTVVNAGVTMIGILWLFDQFHRHLRRQLQEERDRALFSAAHDSLTGLANRETFEAGLKHLIEHQRITGTLSALVMMDLDDFKLVNDVYGHACGDRLLKAVAGNLKDSVRQGDLPARIGGDEFGILVKDLRSPGDLPPILDKIYQTVRQPVAIPHGDPIRVGASLGIALIPEDGDNPETLLHYADQAMYRAKGMEPGYVFAGELKETG